MLRLVTARNNQSIHSIRSEQEEVVIAFQKLPRDRFRIGDDWTGKILGEAEDPTRRPGQGTPFQPDGGARAFQTERLHAAAVGETLLYQRRVVCDIGVLRIIERDFMSGANIEILFCLGATRAAGP